jgi:hypothetical protein
MGLSLSIYSSATSVQYFQYAFDSAYGNQSTPMIPIVQMWNWRPGETFDLFTDDLLIVQVIRNAAVNWGFDPLNFGRVDYSAFSKGPEIMLLDAELSSELSGITGDSTVSRTRISSTKGSYSLIIPYSFDTVNYDTMNVYISKISSSTWPADWSSFAVPSGRISCDMLLRPDKSTAQGYLIRFGVSGKSGQMYPQNTVAVATNYLINNRWTKVSMRLDPGVLKEELVYSVNQAIPASGWISEMSLVKSWTLTLVHNSGCETSSGNILIDNCKLELMDTVATEMVNTDLVFQCPANPIQTIMDTRQNLAAHYSRQFPKYLRIQQSELNIQQGHTNLLIDESLILAQQEEKAANGNNSNRSESNEFNLGLLLGGSGLLLLVMSIGMSVNRRLRTKKRQRNEENSSSASFVK